MDVRKNVLLYYTLVKGSVVICVANFKNDNGAGSETRGASEPAAAAEKC